MKLDQSTPVSVRRVVLYCSLTKEGGNFKREAFLRLLYLKDAYILRHVGLELV
jgi:hypothetical protein